MNLVNPNDDRKQKVLSCMRESGDNIFYYIKANKSFVSNDEGYIYGLNNIQAQVAFIIQIV